MENRPHNEEFREKWFRMPVTEQMADIGKEHRQRGCGGDPLEREG